MTTGRAPDELLLVRNAAAGTADDEAVGAALEVLRARAAVEVATTGSPGELCDLLRGLGGRTLVVAGGDGSVHAAATALRDEGLLDPARAVGLLPLGTGNDLARCLGVPLDPRAAAAVVLDGRDRALDLLEDDERGLVVNVVHAGVGAEAARQATAWKERVGAAGYALGAALAGARTEGWELTVEVDGRVVADGDPVLMVALGTGTTIGGGTPLLPDARPDDGLADVVLVRAVGPVARAAYALHLRRGEHVDRDDVDVLRGRTVRVAGGFPVNADGEVSGPYDERTWTVRPRAWALRVPAQP
ncbi:diacylglycerol/lipid kinase family protein [Vallicoccus soli]|uniref:Diacylglycerol kinase n=1 Tax=Vallicoccus soli TaxID=2339232 RepID=A0A3A3YVP9_9ACTN|nr:diacylglycerol kinase family protein [Vallicoccus soli]RJK94304.1 diacylglycerol kinase [Vallicoccus soli]